MSDHRKSLAKLLPSWSSFLLTSTVALVTTYYYWLLIKPRRKYSLFSGTTLHSFHDIVTYSSDSLNGVLRRLIFRPFITTIRVTDQQVTLQQINLGIGSLVAVVDLDLSGNGFAAFPEALLQMKNLKRLCLSRNKISCLPENLSNFCRLEDLDLGRNKLTSVSPGIGQLKALRFLNLMANFLTYLPDEIGQLKVLYRLGLKSNKLKTLPSTIGSMEGLVELFLTDNELTELPKEIGKLSKLFKLQASFNELATLPLEMGYLPNLELFRIAVNKVTTVPSTFSHLDHLAWFSLAGNPVCPEAPPPRSDIEHISFLDLDIGEKLGDGASGDVFAAIWRGKRVAFKQFKAETSPDGHAQDEIAVSCALDHPSLIKVLAIVEQPSGLVMELLSGKAMAEKPNFNSLLRCRWETNLKFELSYVLRVASSVSSALSYMHSIGICHGDVYAHNVVSSRSGEAVLCDYGASFCYDAGKESIYEAQEVRAYGLFLRDLVNRILPQSSHRERLATDQLTALVDSCTNTNAQTRLQFRDVYRILNSFEIN